ncbi:MAG TPA: CehA/McbA family metallohydrolase, partial [Patescibacteria group bacterium]|nr:CehA/McbA family metallohydrolase [Patescibacteria group bacterium]
MHVRSGFLLIWLLAFSQCLARGQEAVLHGTVRDETGGLSPCTVAITDANGKLVIENESFHAGFRCAGEFTKNLPPGRTQIRVTRGLETRAIETVLVLQTGCQTNLEFKLQRIVDLRKRGWYAGDSHVHMLHGERTIPVTFDFVSLTARAEDLQYMSLAQAWNLENPTPERLGAELAQRSTKNCLLTWNLEAPKNYYKGDAGRCLGHCWNVGMRGRTKTGVDVVQTLIDASAWDYESTKPTYANFESHRLIHQQGGAVFYTHPARWWTGAWGGRGGYPRTEQMRVSNMAVELPLDTVIGPTFDGLDVITGPGERENNEKAFQLWAMLLNHGYRLAGTGSSDACFDRPGGANPGTPRTYTFVPGGFSLAGAASATAAGHTFVTTGPLLIAMIDGKPPGSAFRADKKQHTLAIEAWAGGKNLGGLDRLEILRNGSPLQLSSFSNHPASLQTNVTLYEAQDSWYCVHAWADGPKNSVAITGAFYFEKDQYRSPRPARAQVRASIVDAESGKPLSGRLDEVSYAGTIAQTGKAHRFSAGQAMLTLPATVRLRAKVDGYEQQTLSPFLDNPKLVDVITHLSDTDLLDWKTFDNISKGLGKVALEF